MHVKKYCECCEETNHTVKSDRDQKLEKREMLFSFCVSESSEKHELRDSKIAILSVHSCLHERQNSFSHRFQDIFTPIKNSFIARHYKHRIFLCVVILSWLSQQCLHNNRYIFSMWYISHAELEANPVFRNFLFEFVLVVLNGWHQYTLS